MFTEIQNNGLEICFFFYKWIDILGVTNKSECFRGRVANDGGKKRTKSTELQELYCLYKD